MTQRCFILKNGSSWMHLFNPAVCSSCLWAQLFFLPQLMSQRNIAGRIKRIWFMPQSHQVKYFTTICNGNSRDKQWKWSSVFLNSIVPVTFLDFKSWDASETEITPIEKQSVFIILQMDISSGMISKGGYIVQYITARARVVCQL